jgi:hypothetical protein
MSEEYDEQKWFFDRRTDKTIIGKRFIAEGGKRMRIASRIGEAEGLEFANVKEEVLLRRTPKGRYEIKATLLEDDRAIQTLTIQRWKTKSWADPRLHFSFVNNEIDTLINFIAAIKTTPLPADGRKVHLTDDDLYDMVLDHRQAKRLFERHSDLFREIAQREDITRDLIAVGYRRKQIERFDRLLTDPAFLASEQKRLGVRRPEDVWQQFFEANTWIFGYGLSYQFLSTLDDRKLEQVIRGSDLTGAGKRSDALMKTRGVIGSLCFVELKRHDTPLLASINDPYRSGAWAPHPEVTGAVAQVQTTVQLAIETIGQRLAPRDDLGNPTGEVLFNYEPRSCIVVGSLSQFQTPNGPNDVQFRSFELYRRNTWRPEIVTFDELLQRARFIVDHGEQELAAVE